MKLAVNANEKIAAAKKLLAEAHAELETTLKNEKTRKRGILVQQIHLLRRALLPDYSYPSQAGQDFILDRMFGGKTNGTFVDIGGYDGSTGSNTLFFESRRRWNGLLVEPSVTQFTAAARFRRCACIECAVAAEDGESEFLEITAGMTQMSGIYDTYNADVLRRVRNDKRHMEAMRKVKTRRLDNLLREHELSEIDFVSLDIEGAELAVLESFPFADFRITAWTIENNTGGGAIREIMTQNGYELAELAGVDEIYRLK